LIKGIANITVIAAGAENGIKLYFNKSPLQKDEAPQIRQRAHTGAATVDLRGPGGQGAVESCRPEHHRHQGHYYNQPSGQQHGCHE
jgi:hypothetical protein